MKHMRKPVISAAIVYGIALSAAAQPGARVTLPPGAWQTGQLRFANNCPLAESFQVSVEPPADWLKIEPSTVNVGKDSPFDLQVTVHSREQALGTYRSAVKVFCSTCASNDPPCLLDATEVPIALTVANVGKPSAFEVIAQPGADPDSPKIVERTRPKVYIPPEPSRSRATVLVPLIGGAVLMVAAVGLFLAWRGLSAKQTIRAIEGELAAESERHQVKR